MQGNFNQDIGNWDTSNIEVNGMRNTFEGATNFNQDLTGWCVSNISSEPTSFATSSALTNANKPVWGTCPNVSCTISGTLTSAVGSESQTVSYVHSHYKHRVQPLQQLALTH